MFLLEIIGQFLTLNELLVALIFGTFIVMLFRGVPVAMALVGVALIFYLFALFFLDPFRSAFRDVIEFDRIGIDWRKMGTLPSRIFGNIVQSIERWAGTLFYPLAPGANHSFCAFWRRQSCQTLANNER